MSPAGVTVVDGAALPWVSGASVFETMEPAFREQIGETREAALDLLSRYHLRSLWLDPATSRRIDHVRTDPGYVDLSEAYHDSVEECLFLAGEADLTAEGRFEAGDYFWRPPGWVHSATTDVGFEAVLMMEGEDAGEGSGRVSRVVCDDDEAGRQARPADAGLGPRGYVRRAETRFMPWRPHQDAVASLGGASGLGAKVLSSNVATGAASLLVRAERDWSSRPATSDRERFLVNTAGPLVVDGTELAETGLVHVPAGASAPALSAPAGTELLVKVGGPR